MNLKFVRRYRSKLDEEIPANPGDPMPDDKDQPKQEDP